MYVSLAELAQDRRLGQEFADKFINRKSNVLPETFLEKKFVPDLVGNSCFRNMSIDRIALGQQERQQERRQ